MMSQKSVVYNGLNFSDLSVIATEWKPSLNWLGFRASEDLEATHHTSMNGNVVEDDRDDPMSIDDQINETTDDDEIEDW